MSRQDRQGVRTPTDVERKYNIDKRFDKAMEAAAEASAATTELDKSLDQREVFNRLTNNGKAQGLYIDEKGEVYINASYLATGILTSKDNSTFFLDLDKGILKGRFEEFSIGGKTVDDIAEEKSSAAQKSAQNYADKVAKNEAEKASQGAVDGQTQTDVFNKLTNNGKAHGIYYQGGQLYINASYLATGTIKTKDASTFVLDLAGSKMRFMGKTVKWKKDADGDYVLMGE